MQISYRVYIFFFTPANLGGMYMGLFFGHAGAFFILAAAVAVIGVFVCEAGFVKRETMAVNGKIALYASCAGVLYYFIIGYLTNLFHGQTDIFNFESVFTFSGLDKMIELYKSPSIGVSIEGLGMPFVPYLVHLLGKLIFEQYAGIAIWLNFAAVSCGMCCVYRLAEEFFGADKVSAADLIFAVLILPYSFLMFTPGSFGIIFGSISAAAYALYKKRTVLYVILAVIAVFCGKLGLLVLVPFALSKIKGFPAIMRKLPDRKFIANPYIRTGIFFVILTLSGIVMTLTIGGAIK